MHIPFPLSFSDPKAAHIGFSRFSRFSPLCLLGQLRGKISYTEPPRHPEESGRAPASLAACLLSGLSSLFPPPLILVLSTSSFILLTAVLLSLTNARASTPAVSACTYIRYLRAYIWVPIYRYQMVNERVDARPGRPQLAATQSFVYRGAVCATARTG